MRFVSVLMAAALVIAFASSAMGAIGWAGNIWPCNGHAYTSNDNIGVYVQVWKDGCTPGAGACADIQAFLSYRCQGDPDFIEVPMTYNVDVGNNDEYTGTIPAGTACTTIEFFVRVVDVTDNNTWYPQDQCGNNPNFFLPIAQVTSQDVTVRFHLCLTSAFETSGDVCVTGGHAALTNWGSGVPMSLTCPKLYQVDVLFPAGSNPYVEYKYRKDGCATWENGGNHSFMINDSSAFQDLWIDGWEFNNPDCQPSGTEQATWGAVKALYR